MLQKSLVDWADVEKIDHLWLIELGWQSFVMPLSSAFRRQSVLHDHII